MIAKLLHTCNTAPYCFGGVTNDDFYALKRRLLERYGVPDGHDVQHIPGKPCWSCDGTGTFYHMSGTPDTCFKCYGSGWFKHPVWIVLARHRFGRYTFHAPQERVYQRPKPDVTTIEGYVKHRGYSWRKVWWSALLLSLLFERRIFWRLAKEGVGKLWLLRVAQRRCIDCHHRVWSTRRWRCRVCEPTDLQGC